MSDRDIEKNVPVSHYVETLRRLADSLEAGESFRVQMQNRRFTVPASAEMIIEHEVDDGDHEFALELQWSDEE